MQEFEVLEPERAELFHALVDLSEQIATWSDEKLKDRLERLDTLIAELEAEDKNEAMSIMLICFQIGIQKRKDRLETEKNLSNQ